MTALSHPDIDDVNIDHERPLFSPAYIIDQLPIQEREVEFIKNSRQKASDILHGKNDELLVIV
jgi:phospho-2-dehydro-3-deoxyheptonate aldolase